VSRRASPSISWDEADVSSVLVHERRHRVAEQVAGSSLAEFGGVDALAELQNQQVRLR
jgi:hypothetical protein